MSVPIDFTVIELKEKLRCLNLSTSGAKAELIERLKQADPSGRWMLDDEGSDDAQSIDVTVTERSTSETEEASLARRETELLRKQLEIAERELAVARHELELVQNTRQSSVVNRSTANISTPTISIAPKKLTIAAIADLLSIFDGDSDSFLVWEEQVRYLRTAYQLTDDLLKAIIVQRLKGKAYEWFHSKKEYIHLAVDDLLIELKQMFHRRVSKMELRRQFEDRKWTSDESFSNYFHQKVILANRIQIDEEEMIDYAIAGIPDRALRDQARIHGHKTKNTLLSAFEQVSLREKLHEKDRGRPSGKGQQQTETTRFQKDSKQQQGQVPRSVNRCVNCGASSHITIDCPFKSKGTKCFECREFGHIAAKCPKKKHC